ncbi:MAG: hypothetical protein NDI61_10475, partial [Bdellovibrionaceae bacterium]|nr:hypothetical protein [Pseudobdellovibrionaceae bacterium]
MQIVKWIFGTLLVVVLLAIAGGWVFAQFYLEPYLKTAIEEKGSAALGAPVSVESVQVGLLPPFQASVHGLQLTLPDPSVRIETQTVIVTAFVGPDIFKSTEPLGRFDIVVVQPKITAVIADNKDGSTAPTQPDPNTKIEVSEALAQTRDLEANIEVRDASIDTSFSSSTEGSTSNPKRHLRLSPLNFKLMIPSLRQAWTMTITSRTALNWDGIQVQLPVTNSSTFQFDGKSLRVTKANGDLGGLLYEASGTQTLFPKPQGQWNFKIDVADIARLPVPPSFLPDGKFSGQVQAHLKAQTVPQPDHKSDQKTVWAASGTIDVRQLRGDTKVSFGDSHLTGLVVANLSSEFSWNGAKLDLPKFKADVDLGQADVVHAKMLNKPRGTPLYVDVDAAGDLEQVEIRRAKLLFAQLQAQVHGTISPPQTPPVTAPARTSRLSIEVARTSLAGWEKFFPALAQAPVSGSIELKAQVAGPLDQPELLTVSLTPLMLQNVRGRVQWTSEDKTKSIQGPLEIDARATLQTRGRELLDAQFSTMSELTNLAILFKDTFEKRAGQVLRVNMKADKRGQVIELRPSTFELGQSRFQLRGRIQEPQRPKLQVRLESSSLAFLELASLLPSMRSLIPEGQGSLVADLSGTYDFAKGIQGSPLKTKARFQAQIPRYTYKSETPSQAPSAGTAAPQEPTPLLPDWPILRDSEFQTDVRVGQLLFNDLRIDGIHAKNTLIRGVWMGEVDISKIFDGSVQLSRLRADLKLAQPDFSANARLQAIDANAALSWASAEWKNLVKGRASGQGQATLAHPSRADFAARSKASGDFTLTDAFVSTLQFDKMANDALSKIPGIGEGRRLSSKGVAANIRMAFALENSQVAISNFVFLTPENNQISAAGTLDL